jgi:hypothetical protein
MLLIDNCFAQAIVLGKVFLIRLRCLNMTGSKHDLETAGPHSVTAPAQRQQGTTRDLPTNSKYCNPSVWMSKCIGIVDQQ